MKKKHTRTRTKKKHQQMNHLRDEQNQKHLNELRISSEEYGHKWHIGNWSHTKDDGDRLKSYILFGKHLNILPILDICLHAYSTCMTRS